MSRGPLLLDREKDARRTKEELLDELADMRGQIAALKDAQARCERAGKAQQDSNRIAGMLMEIPESILITDDQARLIHVNSAAERLFKVNREEVLGKHLWDVYPKREGTLFYNMYTNAATDRKPACFRERYRLQSKLLEVYMYPATGGMTIIFRDITTVWHKEEIQRLALTLLHNLKENIFLMRADGRLFHSNPETRESMGYSSDELTHMTIFDLVPQALAGEWQDVLGRIKEKGSMTFESRLRTRDGSEFPVDVYANYIQIYGQDYFTVSARDITERIEAERKLAKYRAEIDASKEQTELYLDLMGHDINNWIMVAMGSLEMAMADLEQTETLKPEDKALMDRSLESLKNSSELISNVQKIQRASTEELMLQTMDMAKVMDDAIGNFQAGHERKVNICLHGAPRCMVKADELLKDVFTNIIGNAIKHAIPEKSLTINIAIDAVDEGGRKYWRAIIEDNGPGIPDNIKPKLFTRYVRGLTKAKGSGLGLYLVHTMVDHYGGYALVEDRVSGDYTQGAKFIVMIPAANEK